MFWILKAFSWRIYLAFKLIIVLQKIIKRDHLPNNYHMQPTLSNNSPMKCFVFWFVKTLNHGINLCSFRIVIWLLWISYLLIWWFSVKLFLMACVSCVSINSPVLAGSRLSTYQVPVGFGLPNSCWHDQGNVSGRNLRDIRLDQGKVSWKNFREIQHQDWTHSQKLRQRDLRPRCGGGDGVAEDQAQDQAHDQGQTRQQCDSGSECHQQDPCKGDRVLQEARRQW